MSPKPVDKHVGQRLRQRRGAQGLSQMKMAEALGLSFQQVQKYERGVNRISASTLYEAARCLKAPVGYFFDGFGDVADGVADDAVVSDREQNFWSSDAGVLLATKFPKIHDARLRNQILGLVSALVAED